MRTERGDRGIGACSVRALAGAVSLAAMLAGASLAQSPVPAPPPPAPVEKVPEPVASQDDDPITLAGDLVLVPVSVRKERGGAVVDMDRSEFALVEDGAPQEIAFFNRDVAPIDVVLLVDGSGSVEGSLDVIQSAALSFIKQLRPVDRFTVVSFADHPIILLDWSTDVKSAAGALRAIEPKGNTALYGSVIAVLYERFDASPVGRRRAVVVLSDGDDTTSSVTSRSAARAALLHDASVYVVSISRLLADRFAEFARTTGIPTQERVKFRTLSDRLRRSEERLEYLASQSGGRVVYPRRFGDLGSAYDEIAEEIRSRYLLGYYPPPGSAPGFHEIGVTTRRKKVLLHARQGYFRDGMGDEAADPNRP